MTRRLLNLPTLQSLLCVVVISVRLMSHWTEVGLG
jgi:hypothetical protein